MSELTYRIVERNDIAELQPIVEREFGKRLPEGMAMAAVAERAGPDGKAIRGFLVATFALHLEPMWIAPEERGRVWWPRLVEMLEAQMEPGTGFYVFANPEPSSNAGMCAAVGMKPTGQQVFLKQV